MVLWVLLVVCVNNTNENRTVQTDTEVYTEVKECTKQGNLVRDMFEAKPFCDKYAITCEKKVAQ